METRISKYVETHREEILNDLISLVKQEAPSSDFEGLAKVRQHLKGLMETRLGIEVEEIQAANDRNVLYAKTGSDESPIVLMGHYDTVHPVGKLPIVLEDNVLKGPGVLDMKAGLIMGIWACRALRDLNLKTSYPVHLMYNGDEEVGSRDSKGILCEKAKNAHCALILEPGVENGDVKSGRKGAMACDMTIYGKASHAGNHPEDGVNAIEEMAHQVLALQKLNQNDQGTTLNVGKISGGTVSNVVPDLCRITVDLRYKTLAEKQRIQKAIEDLPVINPKTQREIVFSDGSNPMEQSEGNLKLVEVAAECAKSFDLTMGHQFVGGASDGNRISYLNVPILDGLGAVGKGIHALDEQVHLDVYFKRLGTLILMLTKVNEI